MSGSGGGGEDVADGADGLSTRKARALEALLQQPTMASAAAAGANERTLRRWLAEPEFRGAVFRARRDAFGQAIWLTQRYAAGAVATLVKGMGDVASPPGSKVAAAGMILKFGREGMEIDDLAERVEALERAKGHGAGRKQAPKTPHRNSDSLSPEEDET